MSARSLFVLLVLQHILLVPNQSAQMGQNCITSNVPFFCAPFWEKTIRKRPGGCFLKVATDGLEYFCTGLIQLAVRRIPNSVVPNVREHSSSMGHP